MHMLILMPFPVFLPTENVHEHLGGCVYWTLGLDTRRRPSGSRHGQSYLELCTRWRVARRSISYLESSLGLLSALGAPKFPIPMELQSMSFQSIQHL